MKTRRFLMMAVLLALAAGAMVACEEVQLTVVISTTPIKVDEPYYADFDGDGVFTEDELIGYMDVYDGDGDLTFTWLPLTPEGVSEENLSYRISLFQVDYDKLLESTEPGSLDPDADYIYEKKVVHHWASNPNGTSYVMGSFGFGETFCFGCLTFIVIVPEIVTQYLDMTTGVYEYEYTMIETDAEGNSFLQFSEGFLLESSR